MNPMSDRDKTTMPDRRLEAATWAVYECKMSDGDSLGTLIHASDYIDDSVPIRPNQIEQVMAICRVIAMAALAAADAVK